MRNERGGRRTSRLTELAGIQGNSSIWPIREDRSGRGGSSGQRKWSKIGRKKPDISGRRKEDAMQSLNFEHEKKKKTGRGVGEPRE